MANQFFLFTPGALLAKNTEKMKETRKVTGTFSHRDRLNGGEETTGKRAGCGESRKQFSPPLPDGTRL
jgi:hypothetical protein